MSSCDCVACRLRRGDGGPSELMPAVAAETGMLVELRFHHELRLQWEAAVGRDVGDGATPHEALTEAFVRAVNRMERASP